jgi:hypothetical protein
VAREGLNLLGQETQEKENKEKKGVQELSQCLGNVRN